MTDFKVSVEILWRGMGVEKKADMYINWSPDTSECSDVDQRVIDFFRDAWGEAYTKYRAGIAEYLDTQQEADERAEYERLRAKFEH